MVRIKRLQSKKWHFKSMHLNSRKRRHIVMIVGTSVDSGPVQLLKDRFLISVLKKKFTSFQIFLYKIAIRLEI